MLELSRRGGRSAPNPLSHPDDIRTILKLVVVAVILMSIAFFAYNGIRRGIPEESQIVPPAAAPAPVTAPYGALRSDTSDPSIDSRERGVRAAAARYEATGGQTTSSTRIDVQTGKLAVSVSDAEPFVGLETRLEVVTVAQQRLGVLSAQVADYERTHAGSAPAASELEAARDHAAAAVAQLGTGDATNEIADADWAVRRDAASTALAALAAELRAAGAAH